MEQLLARLLAAWRETHDVALEEPIMRIGDQIERPPLVGRSPKWIDSAWLERAKQCDPADLALLMAATPWRTANAKLRLKALSLFPDDPRMGPLVMRVRPHLNMIYDDQIAPLVAKSPTVMLDHILDGVQSTQFAPARAMIASVVRTKCDPALLAEARRAIVPRLVFIEEPHVRADQLQQAGDPLGELIAAQLAISGGNNSSKLRTRAATLLELHLDRMIGDLPNPVLAECRVERGMLVGFASTAAGRGLDAAIDLPEWATIETLAIDGRGADLARLIARMPKLRSLTAPEAVLATLKGPFPTIRALGTPSHWFPTDRSAFPNLAILAGSWVQNTTPLPTLAGLHALVHFNVSPDRIRDVLQRRRHGPPEIRFKTWSDDANGWHLAVRRDEPHATIAWKGGGFYSRNTIAEILVHLVNAGITDIAANAEAAEPIEEALRTHSQQLRRLRIRVDAPTLDLTQV